uniref:Putative secreted protein n=1 Tax=Anopheles darlingi TaxID=43151 RepID=A0A2M4D5M4_ANODA
MDAYCMSYLLFTSIVLCTFAQLNTTALRSMSGSSDREIQICVNESHRVVLLLLLFATKQMMMRKWKIMRAKKTDGVDREL